MSRLFVSPWSLSSLSLVLAVSSSSLVLADSSTTPQPGHPLGHGFCGTVTRTEPLPGEYVPGPGEIAHIAEISNVIYLNRCVGGCTVTGSGTHNAPLNETAIRGTVPGTVYTFDEFSNFAGESGAAADAEWGDFVSCVREVYSFYNVTVVDQKPVSNHHMVIASGVGSDLGNVGGGGPGTLLGISDVSCSGPLDNVISYTFTDAHRPGAGTSKTFVEDICWTATHEAGHAFGLEHEFKYTSDQVSACSDPMSYEIPNTCNPPVRYFRNKSATCGGFEEMPCACESTANSHQELLSVFGEGTTTVAKPVASVSVPQAGGQLSAIIAASSGSKRGVERVEFFINGYKWGEAKGVPYSTSGGQPNPATYQLTVPAGVPNSNVDVMVRACDDLGACTDSAVVSAVKGAPCASADTCAAGQKCEAGKCFWDAPTGELGGDCTYDQFCKSNKCLATSDGAVCSQDCFPGVPDGCPETFTCETVSVGMGVCLPPATEAGCCSIGSSRDAVVIHFGLGLGVLGLVLRRRNRKSARA